MPPQPINRVRPGIAAIDPTGALIPFDARGGNINRLLQVQTGPQFDGSYQDAVRHPGAILKPHPV